MFSNEILPQLTENISAEITKRWEAFLKTGAFTVEVHNTEAKEGMTAFMQIDVGIASVSNEIIKKMEVLSDRTLESMGQLYVFFQPPNEALNRGYLLRIGLKSPTDSATFIESVKLLNEVGLLKPLVFSNICSKIPKPN